ncbi:MAG: aminotransferase class V-fold PLP-dependent enzyme [Desulfobacterales bacterium]|nr:MAG: aminotransferase class V-fold PLP-dependent enzyme [Desulfobacterales bacterium]
MAADNQARSRFHLIQGGLQCRTAFASLNVTAAPEESPPFRVDAVAFEEDTWLMMSAEPEIAEPLEHPIRLMTELIEAQPKPVGSVVVRGKNPLQFLAIVHDVNQDPTWREEWVEGALKNIFKESERRMLQAIGLPLLGTKHGRLEKKRFVSLLSRVLKQIPFKHLKDLWLMAPTPQNADIIKWLESEKKENSMIPCQRDMFDLPENITYLNCAYTSPLLKAAQQAGRAAIQAKANPWTIKSDDFFSTAETARGLFARLVDCKADDVAIVPAVSYGIALAARNLPVARDQAIVILQDQFPSNVYAWMRVARENDAVLKTVQRPPDSDWTPAVLEAIDSDTAIVAVPNCHWTDGTLLDLVKISEKCRTVQAALVVDGIQSVGAMPFSIKNVQPDFLVAASHKWLLGAYSFGFCYVAPKWHGGKPLEENWFNRAGSEDFARLVDYRDSYQPGARRFDQGEASNFILAPIAAAGIRQILEWGVANIARTLQNMTDAIADRAQQMGLFVAPGPIRAPHMIGVSKAGGFKKDLPLLLAQDNIFVSVRGDSVRISPHLYTTDQDIDRLFAVLEKVCA